MCCTQRSTQFDGQRTFFCFFFFVFFFCYPKYLWLSDRMKRVNEWNEFCDFSLIYLFLLFHNRQLIWMQMKIIYFFSCSIVICEINKKINQIHSFTFCCCYWNWIYFAYLYNRSNKQSQLIGTELRTSGNKKEWMKG